MTRIATIEDVRSFWEANPLFKGETQFTVGSASYFEKHRSVVIQDCFAGRLDERVFSADRSSQVLDLGCGPGFWLPEFHARGFENLHAADLTEAALCLAKQRCDLYAINCSFSRQNAERLDFPDGSFDHVNCQGVIHHTPNTGACVREIARVLRDGGTACVSVYYKNVILRNWRLLTYPAKLLAILGAKLRGRGREDIFKCASENEIVRLYDGEQNPIGKAYSQSEFKALLAPYFQIDATFLHFFPARSMPIPIPNRMHRLLDQRIGFMIYAQLRKKVSTPSNELAA